MDRREKARRERVKVEIVSGIGPKKPVSFPVNSVATNAPPSQSSYNITK